MRYSASNKYEIIQLVQNSSLSVRQTLARLDIHKSTFYNWLKRYEENGIDGLEDKKPIPHAVWNKITEDHCEAVIELALEQARFITQRTGRYLYRQERLFYLGIDSVSVVERARPHYQSSVYLDGSQ